MNVSLTPELEALISEKVQSGYYHSASEVVREGLRLLKERDDLQRHRLAALRKDIARGLEQLEQGDAVPSEAVFEELRQRSRQRRRAR